MRVGIIQSNYIPWRGYFDFIDDVDLFIFHDDLQYTKGDWRNRNKIKTPRGLIWLTVPVSKGKTNRLICETTIDYKKNWQKDHINQFKENYTRAPCLQSYLDDLSAILTQHFSNISELNVTLCRWIMGILGISTTLRMSQEFQPVGSKTARIIDLLTKVGASTYLTGPSAQAYLDLELFRDHNIKVEFKSYDYPSYPQLWGEFRGEVTILDLLFNTGPEARRFLKSLTPNQAVI
jgi:glutaredoxin-related protein